MTQIKPVLEPQAFEFAKATDAPPFLYQLPPAEGRKAVDGVQSSAIDKPVIDEEWLPVIFYIHGAGWVFGNALTHDRLVRELAVGAGAAVVFPEYDLSPEAKYPIAIEQNYAAAQWVFAHGVEKRLDASRFAVVGDSVGGNMDAGFDTPSYHQFAEHYFLTREGMKWFWDQYTADEAQRKEIYASPLRASTEQLKGLPPALVITAEADVLRDEGEAYAARLREAGVPVTQVRFGGVIHDFVMLNALRSTRGASAAIKLAQDTLRAALH